MDIFKEMDEEGRREVLGLLNLWWKEENIPVDMLRARVVMIFKKGK